MAQDDCLIRFPGRNDRAIGFTGGGGILQPYSPVFSTTQSGVTLEIHFLDANGAECIFATTTEPLTYNVTSTPTGVYGLTRSGSNFLDDLSQLGLNVWGFRAFVRGGSVNIGTGGLDERVGNAANNFIQAGTGTPFIAGPNDLVEWCIVAGAHGFRIAPASNDDTGSLPSWSQFPGANWPGTATSGVAKASAGWLGNLTFVSTDTNSVYLQVFDSATVPADGAWPVGSKAFDPFSLVTGPGSTNPAGWNLAALIGPQGLYFQNGLSWCVSSTLGSKTLTGDSATLFTVKAFGE